MPLLLLFFVLNFSLRNALGKKLYIAHCEYTVYNVRTTVNKKVNLMHCKYLFYLAQGARKTYAQSV